MPEILPNNQGNDLSIKNLSLTERADQYMEKQNEWKNLNGGCVISADIELTLKNLTEMVKPATPDLSAMIRAAVLQYGDGKASFTQIWADKIAEGANYVGVIDGVFAFYKGNQKLETANKPLRISALPPLLEFREKEKELVRDQAREARAQLMADLRGMKPGQLEIGGGTGGIASGNMDRFLNNDQVT